MADESIKHPSFNVNPSDIENIYLEVLALEALVQAGVLLPDFWRELCPLQLHHYFSVAAEKIDKIIQFLLSNFEEYL